MPDVPLLSPRAYAVLRNLVCGAKMDEIPEELLTLKLARAERLKKAPDIVRNVFVATREGRKLIAEKEGTSDGCE
jgi:hypothetical protein